MTKFLGIAVAVLIAASSAAYAQQKQQQPDAGEIDFDCWDLFSQCVDDNPKDCKYGDDSCLFGIQDCVRELNRCIKSERKAQTSPTNKKRPSILDRF